ncbi:MAG TPA: DJ-1/PfpI family protein [Candidatus Faecousia intestinigallinarum]|nr:DJ-1/PfpI family protein [Candidatus Faecousia intestinigallinarum]
MVYILLGTGFEEIEALTSVDLLRRAEIPVVTVGLNGSVVTGGHGIPVQTDISLGEMDLTDLDMIVLPGGMGGVASIRACPEALEAVTFAWDNGKFVAAICAAPTILADLHITDGKSAVCFPSCAEQMGAANYQADRAAIRDGNLITGTSAGCAVPFALALIAALRGDAAANAIAQQIVIR